MKYAAVVFDFDYTLANAEKGIVLCFRKVFEADGADRISDYAIKRTIGWTLEEAFTDLLGVTDPAELERLRRLYVSFGDRYMVQNTVLYSDTIPTLLALRAMGVRIGILSTKYAYRIMKTVEAFDLPLDAIVGGDAVARAKPHPEGMKLILKKLGADRSEVLYVGDSTVDALTAQNACVDFAGVAQGATTREELEMLPHVAVFDRLERILDLL